MARGACSRIYRRDYGTDKTAGKPLDLLKSGSGQKGLDEAILEFTERVVRFVGDYPNVKYIQVENEALKPEALANKRHLSLGFFKDEVSLVKVAKRVDQKILATNSVDMGSFFNRDSQMFRQSVGLADAVGIGVFSRIPAIISGYREPDGFFWRKLRGWVGEMEDRGVEPWVSVCQAEPYERGNLVHLEKPMYDSSNPDRARELASQLAFMGFKTVLFWGVEHWYKHNLKFGGEQWLEPMWGYIKVPPDIN